MYFLLSYAISWAFMLPVAASAQGLLKQQVPYALYYLASFGPLAAALIVTAITEGRVGIRTLLSGLLKQRVGVGYLAFSVVAPIVLFGIAVLVTRMTTGAWPDLWLLGQADYLPYLGIPGVLLLWLLTYGLGEEVGWRGFALPRLQRNRTAASAALILGVCWGLWHLPAFFFRDTYVAMGLLGLPMFLVSVSFASVVFTWLYNSTSGSLLMVVLFHAVFNWLSASQAGGDSSAIIMSASVVAWAIYVVRRYKPENVAPVAKQVAALPA